MIHKQFSIKKVIFILCITIILTVLMGIQGMYAEAVYTGQSNNLTREQLHENTNAKSVITETPAITFLVHGYGCNATTWSNNFNGKKGATVSFVEDPDSIIEKMRNASSSHINLYRANARDENNFILYSEYSENEISTIEDFSAHTIVVVEVKTDIEMEKSYEQLHNIIDKISYDYKSINERLPSVNLIGHSMGGLLTMQYAIEHPKNVDTIVSLGTPYNGSWYDNWFVEMLGITTFNDQPCLSCKCGHSYYFCDFEKRRNAWNEVYAENQHIKFYTLSGETEISLIEHFIWANNYLEDYFGAANAALIRSTFVVIPQMHLAGGSLPGDICVDTDSQKAVGYDGVINYNKKFTTSNCNVNKRSQDNFPVPHNLEAYDSDMHNVILRVVDFGTEVPHNSYTEHGITASIIGKSSNKWLVQVTNNTGTARCFEYNYKMCFDGDAQNWSLGHVECTDVLGNGASTIIEIDEYAAATTITISYDSGNTRYIFYANELDEANCTMSSQNSTKTYYSYTRNNMKVGIISKYGTGWIIKVTNNTGSEHYFEYNQKMCFHEDAKNWNALTDIATTVSLKHGESAIIVIWENYAATSIAISYTNGSTRYIHYANNLSTSGTMSSFSGTRTYYTYKEHGIELSIIGKNGSTWILELTNNTGNMRCFEYNSTMCYLEDAKNWTGLRNVEQVVDLKNGESKIIEINEYLAATSIAISYINGSVRYIFYADNLNISGTMVSYDSTVTVYKYTQNGMQVSIVVKSENTWLINLTNKTGSARKFKYNTKMCNFGDAENWTNLVDVRETSELSNGETVQIAIEENGWATSIAICYEDGDYRKIFYAKDLNVSGTMTDYGNIIDTTNAPTECIAAGTMITLADGNQVPVENLTGNEMLLVWNLETGTYDVAPILFIDSDPMENYEVIKLTFSDDTTVDVISEHGFWDVNLNEYVYLDEYAADYIGHSFLKQGEQGMTEVTLVDVDIVTEVTMAYSPVTYGHLCYYVNGMLSMPGGIDGLFNIFEVDGETMKYEEQSMTEDIEKYGLYTYEELSALVPVTEEMFDAVNAQYLKVAVGKGMITVEQIGRLIERYADMFA